MSIVIKTIHEKRYAYTAYRVGEKVVHKYLGPISKPEVNAAIAEIESWKKIPEALRPLFWDTDAAKIDVKKTPVISWRGFSNSAVFLRSTGWKGFIPQEKSSRS